MKALNYLLLIILLISCESDKRSDIKKSNISKESSLNFKDSLARNINSLEDSSQAVLYDYSYPYDRNEENWLDDIGEVFVMLPDTFFMKHQEMDMYIGLDYEKRRKLVSGQEVVVDKNCTITFDDARNEANRVKNFISLNIFYNCMDGPSVHYYLRYWNTKEGDKIFGLFLLYGDQCCDYSKYWFLKANKNGWIDVTEKVNGTITLHDFKRNSGDFPKNKDFKRFIYTPWFHTSVNVTTDTIKTYLDFNVMDLEVSDEVFDSVENQLNYELQLVWNGREFKKNLIPRTDLDE